MMRFSIVLLATLQAPAPAALPSSAAPQAASPASTPVAVPPGEIHGVVLRPDGTPAAKARVALLPTTQAGRAPRAPLFTTANDQGAFRLDTRGITAFSLSAHLRPFAIATLSGQRPGRRLTVRLEVGRRLTGLVLDAKAGQPLPNAAIEASEWDVSPYVDSDPEFGMIRTTSDAKGGFTLTGLAPSGRFFARAKLRGFATTSVASAPLGVLRFRLAPGRNLEGLVTDASGRPVPGALVMLEPTITSADGITVRSNANGRYEALGLRTVPYDATVTAGGFVPFVRDAIGPDVTTARGAGAALAGYGPVR